MFASHTKGPTAGEDDKNDDSCLRRRLVTGAFEEDEGDEEDEEDVDGEEDDEDDDDDDEEDEEDEDDEQDEQDEEDEEDDNLHRQTLCFNANPSGT